MLSLTVVQFVSKVNAAACSCSENKSLKQHLEQKHLFVLTNIDKHKTRFLLQNNLIPIQVSVKGLMFVDGEGHLLSRELLEHSSIHMRMLSI